MYAKFANAGEYIKAKALELIVCNKLWTKQRHLDADILTEN